MKNDNRSQKDRETQIGREFLPDYRGWCKYVIDESSLVQKERKGLVLRNKVLKDKCAEKGCRGKSNFSKGWDIIFMI